MADVVHAPMGAELRLKELEEKLEHEQARAREAEQKVSTLEQQNRALGFKVKRLSIQKDRLADVNEQLKEESESLKYEKLDLECQTQLLKISARDSQKEILGLQQRIQLQADKFEQQMQALKKKASTVIAGVFSGSRQSSIKSIALESADSLQADDTNAASATIQFNDQDTFTRVLAILSGLEGDSMTEDEAIQQLSTLDCSLMLEPVKPESLSADSDIIPASPAPSSKPMIDDTNSSEMHAPTSPEPVDKPASQAESAPSPVAPSSTSITETTTTTTTTEPSTAAATPEAPKKVSPAKSSSAQPWSYTSHLLLAEPDKLKRLLSKAAAINPSIMQSFHAPVPAFSSLTDIPVPVRKSSSRTSLDANGIVSTTQKWLGFGNVTAAPVEIPSTQPMAPIPPSSTAAPQQPPSTPTPTPYPSTTESKPKVAVNITPSGGRPAALPSKAPKPPKSSYEAKAPKMPQLTADALRLQVGFDGVGLDEMTFSQHTSTDLAAFRG